MLLTTGVIAGLVALGAASPAPTPDDNHGRWSISCSGANKCGYVQSGHGKTHGEDPVATLEGRSTDEPIEPPCQDCSSDGFKSSLCSSCKGLKNEVGVAIYGCYLPFTMDKMCVSTPGFDPEIHNTTGVAVSLLRRGDVRPQYGPEEPSPMPSGPEHEVDEPAYERPPHSSGDHSKGPPKQPSENPYVAPGTVAPVYTPPKPTHAVGKPPGGVHHGEGKSAGPPGASNLAYMKPSQTNSKPSHHPQSPAHSLPSYGPGSSSHGPPAHGPPSHGPPGYGPEKPTPVVVTNPVVYDKPTPVYEKPSNRLLSPVYGPPADQHPHRAYDKPSRGPHGTTSAYATPTAAIEKPSYGPNKPSSSLSQSTPLYAKPAGDFEKPSDKEHTRKLEEQYSSPVKPSGGRPTGIKAQHGMPVHGQPASKDAVSKKPIPYIEIDESECIDCLEGDACYDECDWMFNCGQKKKCFHNGARDIFEICYEKGQECSDDKNVGYGKPKAQSKSHGKPEDQSKSHNKPEAQSKSHNKPEAQSKSHGKPESQNKSYEKPKDQDKSYVQPATAPAHEATEKEGGHE
ncbi:predicted protein [Plenodomus lingam JN3]|uniref:Predicted protein n=1 Tax=Leptosphaeria maculans (strain JN3 / isolate v23.1.3 / race Av1-4-5-6-7-8) TaxID=985895 RepID=E4ZHQ0_LEPMJ|nr:predicted protein [Plenodomus lingam JN3]CBX90883.1 predicted protein [Plenodomus lingam JN3]